MRKKSGVGSGVGGVGGVCNQRCRLSYTKIRKTKRPMRWDWLSQRMGQSVPTGGTIIVFGRKLYLALRRHNVTSVSTYTKTGVRLSIGVG